MVGGEGMIEMLGTRAKTHPPADSRAPSCRHAAHPRTSVMEMASSYWRVTSETAAEPSSSATIGSLSLSRNLAHSGSSSVVDSSLEPCTCRRVATSDDDRPAEVRGGAWAGDTSATQSEVEPAFGSGVRTALGSEQPASLANRA